MSTSSVYQINSEIQKRPDDWIEALNNLSFKESLIGFLIDACQVKVWFEVGLQSRNTLRYISSNQLHYRIGAPLLAYYAFFY